MGIQYYSREETSSPANGDVMGGTDSDVGKDSRHYQNPTEEEEEEEEEGGGGGGGQGVTHHLFSYARKKNTMQMGAKMLACACGNSFLMVLLLHCVSLSL